MFEKELCGLYRLGIHKRLNGSRNYVQRLTSKFDCLSQRKVQSQKLPFPIQ
jgi:hypothetical protein